MAHKLSSARLLDSNGPFEDLLPSFAPREQQLELAAAIERELDRTGAESRAQAAPLEMD